MQIVWGGCRGAGLHRRGAGGEGEGGGVVPAGNAVYLLYYACFIYDLYTNI